MSDTRSFMTQIEISDPKEMNLIHEFRELSSKAQNSVLKFTNKHCIKEGEEYNPSITVLHRCGYSEEEIASELRIEERKVRAVLLHTKQREDNEYVMAQIEETARKWSRALLCKQIDNNK
jgi:hypothetical protein